MGRLIGYARVSTGDQDLKLQLDALKTAGCRDVDIYTEFLNGQPRGPDNHSHGDRVDGVVSGDRQHADAVGHHNMLALAQNAEAGLFQSPHCMQMVDARDLRHR